MLDYGRHRDDGDEIVGEWPEIGCVTVLAQASISRVHLLLDTDLSHPPQVLEAMADEATPALILQRGDAVVVFEVTGWKGQSAVVGRSAEGTGRSASVYWNEVSSGAVSLLLAENGVEQFSSDLLDPTEGARDRLRELVPGFDGLVEDLPVDWLPSMMDLIVAYTGVQVDMTLFDYDVEEPIFYRVPWPVE